MLEQLVKTNPKSLELLVKWVMYENQKQVEALRKETSEDVVMEMTEPIAQELVEAIIKFNIRLLFNFFDEQEIRIGIWWDHGWKHFVMYDDKEVPPVEEFEQLNWDTRIAAELVAFKEAFDALEKRLNEK